MKKIICTNLFFHSESQTATLLKHTTQKESNESSDEKLN